MAGCVIAEGAEQLGNHWVAWEDAGRYYLGVIPIVPAYRQPSNWRNNGVVLQKDVEKDTRLSLQAWLSTCAKVVTPLERPLGLNQYHRRIFRPGDDGVRDQIAMRQTAVATSIVIDRMEQLFTVVEPDEENLSAFGHEIRNLLLLASMEVEAGLRAILQANNYRTGNNHFSTEDYVKLLPVLRLADYQVMLAFYPDVPRISPFKNWESGHATKSLPWYDAYNKTKHDREGNFKEAILKYAIDAVAGAVILAYAQFGLDPILTQRCDIFTNTKAPEYPISEWYLFLDEPCAEMDPKTGQYRRVSKPAWKHVDCPL